MRGLLNKPITRPAPKPSGGWSNGPSTRQRRKADRPVLRFAIAALGARAPQAKLPPHRRSVMNCRRWFSVRRHSPGRGPFVRPGSSRRMLCRPGSAGRRPKIWKSKNLRPIGAAPASPRVLLCTEPAPPSLFFENAAARAMHAKPTVLSLFMHC